MKQGLFTIIENTQLTATVWQMRLAGDTSAITASGQFVNALLEGKFLRRPISVCDCEGDELTLVYKVVGGGTEQMSRMERGQTLDILTGLGNGYELTDAGDAPLLLGGGVGVPPLYLLAKQLIAAGKQVSVVLGFNTADEIFYEEEFKSLGCDVTVTTVDGTKGIQGFVTNAMENISYTHFYTCGPEPMLKAVWRTSVTDGQLSFEERMGCGFGSCVEAPFLRCQAALRRCGNRVYRKNLSVRF